MRFSLKLLQSSRLWLRSAGITLTVVLASFFLSHPGHADPVSPTDILILHSYHYGYKWTDDITRGLDDTLSQSPVPLALHVEYMDTKRVASPNYDEELAAFYQKKFQGISFAVIVCSDNNAAQFMASLGRNIFPDTPVVFCGFNFLRKEDLVDLKGFTGVNEEADLSAGIDLALTLHPETTTLYIINDRTPTGLRVMDRLDEIVPSYKDRVDFTFLDNLSMPDLLATLRTLSEGDLVFHTFFFRDQSGRFFEYDDSIQQIADNCPVPIYGAWDFSLGNGIIGGLLTSGYFQGQAAGKLALRILDGEPVDELPIITESPNRYMFDYQRMAAFKISPEQLPPDSIIINKPPSLYQQYRHAVWAGIAGLMLQLAIIFYLTSNIMRRRSVERTIRQNQNRLNMILETANEGFWEIDPHAVGVNVNAELCAMLQRTRTEIIGHPLYEFTDAAHQAIFKEQLAKRRHGERSQYENILLRPDGTAVHCQFNSSPLYDEAGRFTGSFAMVTDISQRKHAENTLKNREAMLRAIFESTDSGIAVIDETGRISQMNNRFHHLFLPTDDPPSRNHAATLKERLSPYLSHSAIPEAIHKPSILSSSEKSWRVRCRNGRVLDVTAYPLQCDDNHSGGYVFSFRDVTDRIRLESQLLQSQKMEALGTLTSGIAHDFNNILAAILGYTEILQYQFKHRPDALKKIARVLKASHRAKALVQQIHSFSRPQQIEPKPFRAGLIVKEVIKLLQASLPANITIKIDGRTKRDTVTVDPGQIHQVLMNLCSNAVHAMRSEGGELTVILDNVRFDCSKHFMDIVLPEGDYLLLQVNDTGHGMPLGMEDKIFDPYFTTKAKGQGTGLGLSVTLGIVKNHGGAIQVKSIDRQGTRFMVYLPLAEDATPDSDDILPQLTMGNGKVLLVDDESDLIEMMKEMIHHLGYQPTAFTDSRRALAAFRDKPEAFDVAILDMAMPGLSGVELAEAMRKIRPAMPIILCTGYKDQPVADPHLSNVFNRVLMKPLELHLLAEAIDRVLTSSPD